MSPLFRRTRRRDEDAAPDAAEAAPTAETEAIPEAYAEETGTVPIPAAELDALVGRAPDSRRRGRLRRRLRHLRRVREVLLRDLGGLVFEVHRSGASDSASPVVESKLVRLAEVQSEIRALETELDDRKPMVVREAGIGGACPECGEIFGSEARYCWACGTQVATGMGATPLLAQYVSAPQLTAPAADQAWALGQPQDAEVVHEPQPSEVANEPAPAEVVREPAPPEPPAHPSDWIPRETDR